MNGKIDLTVGDLDVLATGSVIAYDGKSVAFSLEYMTNKYTLELVFHSSSPGSRDKKGVSSLTAGSDDTILVLQATNFNDQVPVGLSEPIQVARFANHRLLFNFLVSSSGDGRVKSLCYTFYLSREASDGT